MDVFEDLASVDRQGGRIIHGRPRRGVYALLLTRAVGRVWSTGSERRAPIVSVSKTEDQRNRISGRATIAKAARDDDE